MLGIQNAMPDGQIEPGMLYLENRYRFYLFKETREAGASVATFFGEFARAGMN